MVNYKRIIAWKEYLRKLKTLKTTEEVLDKRTKALVIIKTLQSGSEFKFNYI